MISRAFVEPAHAAAGDRQAALLQDDEAAVRRGEVLRRRLGDRAEARVVQVADVGQPRRHERRRDRIVARPRLTVALTR